MCVPQVKELRRLAADVSVASETLRVDVEAAEPPQLWSVPSEEGQARDDAEGAIRGFVQVGTQPLYLLSVTVVTACSWIRAGGHATPITLLSVTVVTAWLLDSCAGAPDARRRRGGWRLPAMRVAVLPLLLVLAAARGASQGGDAAGVGAAPSGAVLLQGHTWCTAPRRAAPCFSSVHC